MVKIPGLDELRKMGSDLMNSAKNVDMSGVVDKIKNRVETVSEKFAGTPGVKNSCDRINAGLNELMQLQPQETQAIKKIQAEVAELQTRMEATQQSSTATNQTTTTTTKEPQSMNQSEEKKQ